MAEKNLVEEALLQMENLQEAITNNAKGILASTMKEEISELVKESLSEEDEVKESETEMSEQEELDLDIEDVEVEDEDEGEEGLELDLDALSDNEDDEELEMGDEEMLMTDLPGDDLEVDDEEEVLSPLDLTSASDDEVLKVFKAMGEEDGIIVKQDDDEIHLSDDDTETEYVIQLGESEEEVKEEDQMEEGEYKEEDQMKEGEYTEEDQMEEEVVYEIEIGEEEVSEEWNEEEMSEGQGYDDREDEKEGMEHGSIKDKDLDSEKARRDDAKFETREGEEEMTERSLAQGQRASSDKSKGLPKPKTIPNKARYNESLEKEVSQLREKNEEYRKALSIFKEKLNEVAVFNSNLAYATRLFTEHSTTKQEKINILRRFDGVETLKESKSLYKTIKEDLGGKETTVMTESVQSKVQKTPTKGSANNLIESKTYENPQFLRMRDLMNKLK
jgi:hypothetical protein